MFLQEKAVETTKQKGKRRKKPTGQSPRNMEACHSIGATLMQSITNT
jgi:hypothetical protein